MNKEVKTVPKGIQYISEWKEYTLPTDGHVIVDKGVTGCGYTEFCLMNQDNVVLCSPRKLLLENKAEQHLKKKHKHILYLENTFKDPHEHQSMSDRIREHILNCNSLNLPVKFMVTYDSMHYVSEVLKKLGILNDFIFVVDEFQSIFLDSYFKVDVELEFVEHLQDCKNVIYLSATPMLDKYLDRLPEFKDLKMYLLDWRYTGYVETILVGRKNVNSLCSECIRIVKNYLNGKFATFYDEERDKVLESKEAVFYFNSVSEIIRVISKCGLTPENTIIVCSRTEENEKKLSKVGFNFGKIPTEEEPNPMFTFCTSAVYMGVDFYSKCASSFVFADPNVDCLALDISLDLPQIIGRQRDKSNPFKNNISIFYKIKRKGEKEVNRDNYIEYQNNKRKKTKDLLDLYQKATKDQKISYLEKLERDIINSKYSYDFVSISKKTGEPIYNSLIDIADERAWEVSQRDYQDKLSVTRALRDAGFYYQSNFQDEDSKILQEFLDNNFFKTNRFDEKMRMYCEFRDKYKDNENIIEGLEHKITNSKIHQYYKFYGTSGCSSRRYRENELEIGLKNSLLSDELAIRIYLRFKEGEKISMSEAKSLLIDLYKDLGISKAAKATDLGNYFKIFRTKVVLGDGTIVNGFKLGEKLQ